MRLLLILPCCIGDVVMATATLQALRRGYPDAHITWAVGGWSRRAVEYHPALNAILDTGSAALPVKSPGGFFRFVRQVRAGHYDMLVSLVRSPLMSLAALLSGVPQRAGLDSSGRGFGYNIKARIDPRTIRPEGDIYLDTARALRIDTTGCFATLPVLDESRTTIHHLLTERGIRTPYVVIHPGGGQNPGMVMDSKRYPSENFAALANALADEMGANIILVGAKSDFDTIQQVQVGLKHQPVVFCGELSLQQTGALAASATLYIGNDTGMTHLAAASGAKTVMILGPSDPRRYAPFTPNSLALWKPAVVQPAGVAAGTPAGWNWQRDGIAVDEALAQIRAFLRERK
jgi:ADP-heptose:LPS heptosyltransferase